MKKSTLFEAIITHCTIVLGLFFIVLHYLDKANPGMNFLGSKAGRILLYAFCVLSLINSIRLAAVLHKKRLSEYKQLKEKAKNREIDE